MCNWNVKNQVYKFNALMCPLFMAHSHFLSGSYNGMHLCREYHASFLNFWCSPFHIYLASHSNKAKILCNLPFLITVAASIHWIDYSFIYSVNCKVQVPVIRFSISLSRLLFSFLFLGNQVVINYHFHQVYYVQGSQVFAR